MNFLAHLFLSEPIPEARIGNLMGDFKPGELSPDTPAALWRGLWLHTRIDAYTDAHPVVQQSKHMISSPHQRFAGIVIDVFYDHFLAKDWDHYFTVPLPAFARQVYADLRTHEALLPLSLQQILPDLIGQDWLTSYRTDEGIAHALQRIAWRLSRLNHLPDAVDDLRQHRDILQSHFDLFFPDLMRHVAREIEYLHTGEEPDAHHP
jgi:acyl carrier protein phosphodiesterase